MERIASVHALRGIAVLMVCTLHFFATHNTGDMPDWIREVSSYGFQGVTVFFVISGFVMPLALERAGYTLRGFPRFVARRLVRLEPPYLVAIAIIAALQWLSSRFPGFRGPPYEVDWWQLAAHVPYIAPWVGKPWVAVVFWTLAIEIQFYLLIGLTFPLLRRYPVAWIMLLGLSAMFDPPWEALPYHLPVFLVGTAAYAWKSGLLTKYWSGFLALLLAGFLAVERSPDFALVAIASAAYILWAKPAARWLLGLGTISYSLYLLHLPVGLRVIHLLDRVVDDGVASGIAAFIAVLPVAIALWWAVERPALRWSARIGYRPTGPISSERAIASVASISPPDRSRAHSGSTRPGSTGPSS